MMYTVEMRRSPDITDDEVRHRLATCYSLLLDLAQKRESDVPGGDSAPVAGAPGDNLATACQESDHAESESDTGKEHGDRPSAH